MMLPERKKREHRAISATISRGDRNHYWWNGTPGSTPSELWTATSSLFWQKEASRSKAPYGQYKFKAGDYSDTSALAGRIHDKRQLDEENLIENIPSHVKILGDSGFQGLQNEYVNIHLPQKKPKGKPLSSYYKRKNKKLSRQRVVCEHAHAGMKRYNAVSALYRNRVPDFDDHLMVTAAGLWNFYLEVA